jgi:CpeT/CpcT family (DUF1001)
MGESLRAPLLVLMVAASALLASCAGNLKKAEADLAELEAWLPGRYDNMEQAQKGAAHTALALNIVPIFMPTFGMHVFYLQESAADDPRRITSQRLLSFQAVKEGHVLETIYTLSQPGRWRDGHLNPDLFKGMMYNDATPLAGCELLWKKEGERFLAASPTEGCRATVPALGGGVRLQIRAELTAEELSLAEQAFNASGQLVQGNATEPFYRFRKRAGS